MDPLLSSLPHGARASLVAQIQWQSAPGCFQCVGLSPKQEFQLCGDATIGLGICTLYDAVILGHAPLQLGLCESSEIYSCRELDSFQKVAIYDVCSGMGGFSLGSHPVGVETTAFLDTNPLACAVLRCNFTTPVIQGSIDDIQCIKKLHAMKPSAFTQLTGGFPCQPFSKQGDQRGLKDCRGQVLQAILRGSWLLQVDSVLLECVDNVLHFDDIQQMLDMHAKMAGMNISKIVFDLQAQWPVRRSRFWCLLNKNSIPKLSLCPWPQSSDRQTLGDIIPFDAIWLGMHEQDLAWDDMENAVYSDLAYGHDLRVLNAQCKAPTMLHSWANVLRACPCGCRQHPMSDQRLLQGGARGFGIFSALTSRMRHLHPEEAALLCTVPLTYVFPEPPRTALCLLGQIAAPLQVLWLQSQLIAHLQEHFWLSTSVDPVVMIQNYMNALLEQRLHRWTLASMYLPRSISVTMDGLQTDIKVCSPVVVRELEHAESALIGDGYYVIVKYRDCRLPPWCHLQEGVQYQLEVISKKQARCIQADGTSPCMMRSIGLGDSHFWLGMKLLLDFRSNKALDLPFMLYPFRAQHLLQLLPHEAVLANWKFQLRNSNGDIIVIFEHANHWILLVGRSQHGLCWEYYDGLPADGPRAHLGMATQVARWMSTHLGLPHGKCQPAMSFTQQLTFTCGTIALMNLAHYLNVHDCLPSWDEALLHGFFQQLLPGHQRSEGHIVALGLPNDLHEKLANVLQQHGVPAEAAQDRARLVTQKLGIASIKEAFAAKNCWAYLKAIANRPSVSLRLVLPDELSRHVASTASSRFGADIANAKAKKKKQDHKTPATPLSLDPEQLVLTHSCFRDTDDDIVQQIPFKQVEAEASGIAICNIAQACHFLQTSESISTNPLALLLIERPPKDFMEQHDIKEISFAAKYIGTGEPVLIFGALKNLGDIQINQHIPGKCEQPAVISMQVIKIQVFRDEFQGSWPHLAQAPVRTLCMAVPQLQLCQGKECGSDCQKSHAAVDEEWDSVLLEIWSRSFSKLEGGKAPAADAQIFGVFIRIPSSILDGLLQTIVAGIYFEPRSTQNKGHDARYRVIWLPARTLDEAMHTCRTKVHALGLVRMKKKYGIRVLAEHEEQMFRQIKPDATWVNAQVQRVFQLFPLPHGLQRAGAIKLLQDLDWAVKPLQPGRGSAEAMSWQVGASSAPPTDVITGFGKEILITEITKESKPVPQPRLVASAKTHQHLRAEASSSAVPAASSIAAMNADPWMQPGKDPWKTYIGPRQPNTGKSHLHEVTGCLKEELETAMQQKSDELFPNTLKPPSPTSLKTSDMRHKKLIDMCKSTGQKKRLKQNRVYIYISLIYIYTKNAVVNTQTSEAKTPHQKNLKKPHNTNCKHC
jgi:hypothetical protein